MMAPMPVIPYQWFSVQRISRNVTSVSLRGVIGLYGLGVAQLIKQIGDAPSVEIAIDVEGGKTDATFDLVDAIEGRFKSATIVGKAHSSGAIVALAAKHLKMKATATLLLHRCKVLVWGDETVLLEHIEGMRRFDRRLAKLIEARTGQDASPFFDGRDHLLNSAQAKDLKLIDEIV